MPKTPQEKISYQELISKAKPVFEEAITTLTKELQGIRTSHASPSLFEDVEVQYFDQKYKLKQLAAIYISGPREITIQPWDGSYIDPILKALEKKSLGTIPVVKKNVIVISLPPISEEFKKELLKLVSEKKERAKEKIRKKREEIWKILQEGCREGKLSEDDKYRGKNQLQKLVDEYNQKIEDIVEKKKKEILE
jgi:ribosome recycling factor